MNLPPYRIEGHPTLPVVNITYQTRINYDIVQRVSGDLFDLFETFERPHMQVADFRQAVVTAESAIAFSRQAVGREQNVLNHPMYAGIALISSSRTIRASVDSLEAALLGRVTFPFFPDRLRAYQYVAEKLRIDYDPTTDPTLRDPSS